MTLPTALRHRYDLCKIEVKRENDSLLTDRFGEDFRVGQQLKLLFGKMNYVMSSRPEMIDNSHR